MRILTRLRNIFLLTLAFLALFGMVLTTDVQAEPSAINTASPGPAVDVPSACDATHPDTLTHGASVTLSALDGEVSLMDTPVSSVVRFPAPTGTPAHVLTSASLPDGCWYLVELTDASQGWVPASALAYN